MKNSYFKIRFFFLFLFAILMIGYKGYAQTNVSGGIYSNTTWTVSNSPYIITDTLVVFGGATLTIQPGVTVEFDNGVYMNIKGNLIANGTATDSIIFTSSSSTPFAGIYPGISPGFGVDSFSYCRFSYASVAVGGGIFSNCVFNSDITALYLGGAIVENCIFKNDSTGITEDVASNLTISGCQFVHNGMGIATLTGPISNCTFTNNRYGIYGSSDSHVEYCTFDSNTVYGLGAEDDSVRNCTFRYNQLGISSTEDIVILNNISNNTIGIKTYGDYIACNSICNNAQYNLVLTQTNDENIAGNYWCLTDSASIQSTVYDGHQNLNLGLALFMPFDSTACDSIVITNHTGNILPVDTGVCSNSPVLLIAPSGGTNYVWSPSTGLSATTGQTVFASPTVTTTYTVVYDYLGRTDSSSTVITVIPSPNKPLITQHGDTLISSSSYDNQWYHNDTLLLNDTSQYFIMNNISGCYFVTVTNEANGCSTTSDSLCTGAPIIKISPLNPEICNGASVTLTITSQGSNYIWSPSTGLSSTTGTSVIASPTVTTTYTVTGLDTTGQAISGQDVVSLYPPGITHVHYDTIFVNGNNLQWYRNDTLISIDTANNFYVAKAGNWYKVINPVNGCPDSVYIGAPGQYVWPGDANDDLSVNYNDLISIGLYYGDTGTTRDTVTNAWAPHQSTNWNELQYCGIDKKYADCNGDGVINSDDTLAITLNYGLTHPNYSPRTMSRSTESAIPLSIVTDSSAYSAGSLVHASIMLGNSTTPVTDMYGLSYSITFDNSIVEPSTMVFNYDDTSFFGTKNLYVLALDHINIGSVQAAMTGYDHNNRTGYGKIADLYFIMGQHIIGGQQTLSVNPGIAVDNDGNPKAIVAVNATVTVTTGIPRLSPVNNHVSIYPNPSSGAFTIASVNTIQQIKVIDMLGQVVYEAQPMQRQVNFEINNSSMYFITVTANNETTTQKIIVTK